MAKWLLSLFRARGECISEPVRETLLGLWNSRARLSLELSYHTRTLVLTSTVEEVRTDDFLISQPTIDGRSHPLNVGDTISIGFVRDSRYHSGACRCLGRTQIPIDSSRHTFVEGQSVPCYCMSFPESFRTYERRKSPRVEMTFPHIVEAHLYASADRALPLVGRIENISVTGASITVPAALAIASIAMLKQGQQIYVKAMLPEPVGKIDDLVTVMRVEEMSKERGEWSIGVRFHQRIAGLETLLRAA